jgi:hypothetical protein
LAVLNIAFFLLLAVRIVAVYQAPNAPVIRLST